MDVCESVVAHIIATLSRCRNKSESHSYIVESEFWLDEPAAMLEREVYHSLETWLEFRYA
jgi:hypothetical protein